MKKRTKFLYLLAFFLLVFGLIRLYYFLTDDFRISNITYEFPFHAPWKSQELTFEQHHQLAEILKQNFFYLGKGAQCYAFESEDRQYVLKFFKFKHLKPNWFVNILPSMYPFEKFKARSIERKNRKLIGVFNGYDLAYREHRQDSNLLFLHLVPTNHLNLHATIFDKIGFKREIPLDEVVFLIQRKGETLRTRLNRLLRQNEYAEAEQALAQLFAMFISEYQKGIYDHDHGVLNNTGFIANRPFHLDVGKLNKDERMKQLEVYKMDFQFIMWKIAKWIHSHYPQYEQRMMSFLAQQYDFWIGEIVDFQTIDPKKFKKSPD